jgi:germination protein M
MRRMIVVAAAAAFALLASGCGDLGGGGAEAVGTLEPAEGTGPTGDGGTTTPEGSEPNGTAQPSPEATGNGEAQTMTYEVWLTLGDHLFVTRRTEPFDPGIGAAAIRAVLAGPTAAETRAGVGTAVPPSTELLGLTIEDGVATVDLSGDFEGGGGSLSMTMRLAQVVYTLTQFGSVSEGVRFRLDGEDVTVFSGEGIVLEGPVDRLDYRDLFPILLVESPLIGARVTDGDTVVGMANVFEATVVIRVLDEGGQVILEDFTTATCGTGCWGSFRHELSFEVDHEQPGTVVVMETDPSGGEGFPPRSVAIPVTLIP